MPPEDGFERLSNASPPLRRTYGRVRLVGALVALFTMWHVLSVSAAAADPYCTFAISRNAVAAQGVSPAQEISPYVYTLLLWPGFNKIVGDCVAPDGSKVTMPHDGWLEMEGEVFLYRPDHKTISYAVIKPIADFTIDSSGHEVNGADQPCVGQTTGGTTDVLSVPWSCRIWLAANRYVGIFLTIASAPGSILVDDNAFHTHWSGRAGP